MCRCPYICIQYLTPYSCYIYTITTSISFASVCCYENNQRDVLYVNLRQPVGVCICVCVFACSERAQLGKTNAYSMCALEHLRHWDFTYSDSLTRTYTMLALALSVSLVHAVMMCRRYSRLQLKDLLILWCVVSLTVVLGVLCAWIPQFFMNFLLNWSQRKRQVKRSQSCCSHPHTVRYIKDCWHGNGINFSWKCFWKCW